MRTWNIIHQFVKTYNQYQATHRIASTEQEHGYGYVHGLLHWITPNGGTILLIALLILTQNVWARRTLTPSASSVTTIPYQGRLADISGDPVTGRINMEFRLYDVPTGGSPLWEEFWTGSNAVNVSDGLFSVMLGSINPSLVNIVQGHGELYLGITVGTDSEMEPRVQLGSVPFSVWSLTVADDSITADKIASGAVGSDEIAPNAVGSEKIAANAVSSEEIAPNAVGSEEIAPNAVNSEKIANASVTTNKIADESITTEKIATGAVTEMWYVSPTSKAYTSNTEWTDVPETSITFNLPRAAHVFFLYSMNVQFGRNVGTDWLGTRLVVDGMPYRSTGDHYQPHIDADWGNSDVTGSLILELSAGQHTVTLQWRTGHGDVTWSTEPDQLDGYAAARTISVIAFYR